MWQMVADLPATCAGTFENYAPLASANAPPRQRPADVKARTTPEGELSWGCDVHSLCQACSDLSTPTTLNKYCQAVLLRHIWRAPPSEELDIFVDFHADFESFWCQPDVLASIEDGTFELEFGSHTR